MRVFSIRVLSSPQGYLCAKFRFVLTSIVELAREEKSSTQTLIQSLTRPVYLMRREQWRREGGEGGIRLGWQCAGGGIWRGENGILKFGRFWQTGICIADSDIFTPLTLHQFWDHTPDYTQSSVHTKKLTLLI